MKKFIYGLLAFGPVLALAQGTFNGSYFISIIQTIGTIVKDLIPVMFGLAIVYFFWGMIKYIMAAGEPEKAKEGKSIMIYGVIAIAVMAALFGLVTWLTGIFGIGSTNSPLNPPTVTGLGS